MDGSSFSRETKTIEQHTKEMIEFGKELIKLKKQEGHGNWKNYIKENFQCSPRTCQYAMKLAQQNIATNNYSLGTEKLKTKMEEGKMEPIIIKSDDLTKVIIDQIRTNPDIHFTLVGLLEEASQTEKRVTKSKTFRVVTELVEKGVVQRTNQKAAKRVIFEKVPDAIDALILQHDDSTRDQVIRVIQKFSSKPEEKFTFLQIYQELQKEDPNISESSIRNNFQHIRIGGIIKEDGRLADFPKIKVYRFVNSTEKEEPSKAKQTITRDEVFDTMVARLHELKKLRQEHNKALTLTNSLREALKYAKEQSIDEVKTTNSWKQCSKELEEENADLRKIKERNEDLGKLLKEKSEADERIRYLTSDNLKLREQISNPDIRIDAIKTAHKEERVKLIETIKRLRKGCSEKDKEIYSLKISLKKMQEEKTINL